MLTINSSIFLLFRKVNLPWPILSSSVNFSRTFDLFIAVQFGSVFRVHINLGVPYLFLHSDFPYCIWSKLSSLYHRRTWPGKPIYCFLLFFIYCFTIVLMQICLLYVLHHFHMRNSVHPSFFSIVLLYYRCSNAFICSPNGDPADASIFWDWKDNSWE